MWVFCKNGFFSAVRHRGNRNMVHVRARFEGDLERLCFAHGVAPRVEHTPGNDYPWRMDFGKQKWSNIMKKEAEAIDYENFKSAVHDGTKRDTAYMNCWWALRQQQDTVARQG